MMRFGTLIALLLLTAACGPSPELVDAHLLERAASWASAVEFARELRESRSVPRSYVRQVMAQGAREVRNFESQFATTDRGPILCARLSSALTAADDRLPDRGQLRDLEMQLRDLARDRRRAAEGAGAAQ
jgi:hypothetical protein